MNFLKKIPYWLRGGIIASVVLIGFGFFFEKTVGHGLSIPDWLLFFPEIVADAIEPLFCQPLPPNSSFSLRCLPVRLMLLGILFIVECFVFGALLGWLYGMFRKRKDASSFTG